jgi:hypothetical protein
LDTAGRFRALNSLVCWGRFFLLVGFLDMVTFLRCQDHVMTNGGLSNSVQVSEALS